MEVRFLSVGDGSYKHRTVERVVGACGVGLELELSV